MRMNSGIILTLVFTLILAPIVRAESWYIYEHDMTTEDLNFRGGPWGADLVVGDNGTVLACYYSTALNSPDDKSFIWEDISIDTSEDLYGSDWGYFIYVVGTNGAIFYSEDGGVWFSASSPTTNDLFSVSISVTYTDGFIVGAEGTILSGGGNPPVWELYEPSPTSQDLYSVSGEYNEPDTIWAVGAGGTILDYEDGVWSLYPSSPTSDGLYGVNVLGENGAWACGAGGTILIWDGVSWSLVSTPTTEDLYSIWHEPWHIFCVGVNGTILESGDWGETWVLEDTPVAVDLHGVGGYEVIWAEGEGGTILSRGVLLGIQPTSLGKIKAMFGGEGVSSAEAPGKSEHLR